MSCVLGIDTSSSELGVGLIRDGKSICSFSRYLQNSHAENISAAIEFMMTSNNIKAEDISLAGVAVGPGSFTGLRIGIGFIKGFFFGRPVKIAPVSSLESAAWAWNGPAQKITVAFDARKGLIFWAKFRVNNGRPERVTEDRIEPVEALISSLDYGDVVLTDSLGYAKSTAFTPVTAKAVIYALEDFPVQRGLACARIADFSSDNSGTLMSPVDILPRYMQESYAEKKSQLLQ